MKKMLLLLVFLVLFSVSVFASDTNFDYGSPYSVYDNFNDNSLATDDWTTSLTAPGTVTETSQQLQIVASANNSSPQAAVYADNTNVRWLNNNDSTVLAAIQWKLVDAGIDTGAGSGFVKVFFGTQKIVDLEMSGSTLSGATWYTPGNYELVTGVDGTPAGIYKDGVLKDTIGSLTVNDSTLKFHTFRTTAGTGSAYQYIDDVNFVARSKPDTNKPVIDKNYLFLLSSGDVNLSFNCRDTNSVQVYYNLKRNDLNVYSGWITGYADFNVTTFLVDGANDFNFTCRDYAGNGVSGILSYPIEKTLIKIPKDEKTGALITPFTIKMSGGSSGNYPALSGDFNVQFFNNAFPVYIDVNSDSYFTRRYTIDDNTVTEIQPYLVSTATGYQANIFVLDAFSGTGKKNINIQSWKTIGTTLTMIEDRQTDSIGNVRLSFTTDETYTLYLIDFPTTLLTTTINADQPNYYFYFGMEIPPIKDTNFGSLDINFFPSKSIITQNDLNKLDFNQSIKMNNIAIASIDINISVNDKNIFSETNSALGFAYAGRLYQDVNRLKMLDLNFLTGSITIKIKVLTTDGNVFYASQTYTFWDYEEYPNFYTMLTVDLPNLFGGTANGKINPALLFLSLIITIFAISGLTKTMGFNTIGIGVFTIAFAVLFSVLGWMPIIVSAIISFFAFVLIMLGWRRQE